MADAPAPPPKKKLPFKPTALRTAPPPPPSQTGNDDGPDDGLDLFRRSKEMAPIVAAEQMRRWKKKQRQIEDEEEARRRSSGRGKRTFSEDGREPRREAGDDAEGSGGKGNADEDDDDGDLYAAPSTQGTVPALEEEDDGAAALDLATPPPSKRSRLEEPASSSKQEPGSDADSFADSPSSRVLRSRAAAAPATPSASNSSAIPTATEIVILDSDSEPELPPLKDPAPAPPPHDELVEDDPLLLTDAPSDDDEFAEYVRRAEQQRARDLASQTAISTTALPTETPPPKEIIEIIITSDLPNSKPCCIKFLFDRPLRLVRDSWIALQRKHSISLPVEQDDDVVLTWRRKRVYMFSALLNLGIRPKGDGTVIVEGNSYNRDGLAEARTRVHMEAWTPELFAQMEHEEEVRQRREAGDLLDDSDAPDHDDAHGQGAAGDAAGAEEEEAVKLRIILKPRDLEAVKLMVRPETTVDTLVTAFRTQRAVAEDADVGLWFDGLRLEEGTTMEDAEIDDMDTIEVHIK